MTQYEGAATAFSALSDATADTLYQAYQTHPQYFTARNPAPSTIQEFRDSYAQPLRDFNTAGVVSAHLGRRLSNLQGGYYQIHGVPVQINSARVQECLQAVDAVVGQL